MQSSKFGCIWDSMFLCAMGYHLNKTPCKIKNPQYKLFFESFGNVLPCLFCRDSYKIFFNDPEFKIDDYFTQKWGLVRYVYDLKEKVNNKLRSQETKKLKEEYNKLDKNDPAFWEKIRQLSHNTCYTKNTPSYDDVLKNLLNQRANCSNKESHCRDPLSKNMTDSAVDLLNTETELEGGKKQPNKKRSRKWVSKKKSKRSRK